MRRIPPREQEGIFQQNTATQKFPEKTVRFRVTFLPTDHRQRKVKGRIEFYLMGHSRNPGHNRRIHAPRADTVRDPGALRAPVVPGAPQMSRHPVHLDPAAEAALGRTTNANITQAHTTHGSVGARRGKSARLVDFAHYCLA